CGGVVSVLGSLSTGLSRGVSGFGRVAGGCCMGGPEPPPKRFLIGCMIFCSVDCGFSGGFAAAITCTGACCWGVALLAPFGRGALRSSRYCRSRADRRCGLPFESSVTIVDVCALPSSAARSSGDDDDDDERRAAADAPPLADATSPPSFLPPEAPPYERIRATRTTAKAMLRIVRKVGRKGMRARLMGMVSVYDARHRQRERGDLGLERIARLRLHRVIAVHRAEVRAQRAEAGVLERFFRR